MIAVLEIMPQLDNTVVKIIFENGAFVYKVGRRCWYILLTW